MILQVIVLTITLATLGGAAMLPVVETDLQLTASDGDTGNWTANLGNMEINIEHKHDSANNATGTWTLGIARTFYKDEEASNEKEKQKSETVQINHYNDEITSMNLPQEVSNLNEIEDNFPASPENNEIHMEQMPIEIHSPDYSIRFPHSEMPEVYGLLRHASPPVQLPFPFFSTPEVEFETTVQDSHDESRDTENDTIGTDYECFKGVGWFKLDKRQLTWDDARDACEAEDAHLAVPDTPSRVQVFLKLFQKHPDILASSSLWNQVYVGVNDPEMNRIFKTVQGKLFNPPFQIWDVNEPNNFYPGEYCVGFQMGGRTNDIPCYYQLPFFCEKDINVNE